MEELKNNSSTGRARPEPDPSSKVLRDLFEKEYRPMVRVAFMLLGDNNEAEDVVQDALVEVQCRLNDIRNPGAYLRSAVVSRCTTALRRRQMAARMPVERPLPVSDDAAQVWALLPMLPIEQRTAIVLKFVGGYRSHEIAAVAGVSSATIRSRVRRGLMTLRKEVDA